MFQVGDIVVGPHFPESVEIKRCDCLGDFYIIEAVGRESLRFFEIMVDQTQVQELSKLNEETTESHIKGTDIQAYLQYLALKNEVKFSKTRALGNKKLMPLPHQIEAVYSRMLQVPQIRFLLADDPGAGKTIMSGMLIKELKARYSVDRILILVPPLVLKQWQDELLEKFNEHFHIVTRGVLNEYGGKNPFIINDFCLASVYWAARDDIKSLVKEAEFDLIIVDEAHKMAAYTHGTQKKKTTRTKLYQLGEAILPKANHCVLLTATPHKGDMENFRHLMRLIDEDVFSNISNNESLREKTNPFMIRRLKENLKNFDGTPLFPRRTTKTLKYELSDEELALYDAVTLYVKEHFNRAINNGSNSTAFAMMLLQRRLSSSLEAITLSLKRRYKRLVALFKKTEEDRQKYLNKLRKVEVEQYQEESYEEQDRMESQLEQAVDLIDTTELKKEIFVLKKLIEQAELVKTYGVERKYQELEKTLFGSTGLLHQGEKILIFTESADTLNYLEKKLKERVPQIAKIVGSYSIDERRRQVELFRNDCQIMLATDAGGESINLQFCNQMINYDIPWNPNKIEQRMGRIHRIGQKNEVFVFNLVASNTREGSVLIRLLEKMEQMKEDLGSDLVYDFVGEVLEDEYQSLADLMQEAILNREHLEDVIQKMDKTISEEYKNLMKVLQDEKLTDESMDLSILKREQNEIIVERVPLRSYSEFTTYTLQKKKVRIYDSNEGKVKRIERLPKFIREQFAEYEIMRDSIKYTGFNEYETEDTTLLNGDHPLFLLTLELMRKENEKQAWTRYLVTHNIPESLMIDVYNISIVDGTGKELESHFVHLAKRDNGENFIIDPYWVYFDRFQDDVIALNDTTQSESLTKVLGFSTSLREQVKQKREQQLDKLQAFVEKSFHHQYRDTLEKLEKYQQENIDNRNSALINQMNAQLIDLDVKREERVQLILRQKQINMKPPKKVLSLQVAPIQKSKRVMAIDYKETIERYEKANGRRNIKMFNSLALVDFYSERFNGEERYIILTNDESFFPSDLYLEDLDDILGKVHIYVVKDDQVVMERALKDEIVIP